MVLLGVAVHAAPGEAKSGGDTTWGKAGVSLADYARDANECADATRRTDVSIKPDTLRELAGLSSVQLYQVALTAKADTETNLLRYVSAMDSYRTADDIARRTNTFGGAYVAMVRTDVVDELQTTLDRCLWDRGYRRMRLSADQSKTLSHLKHDTPERTRYLHSIGSDAALIESQRILPAAGG
jgi:hypothetical protein